MGLEQPRHISLITVVPGASKLSGPRKMCPMIPSMNQLHSQRTYLILTFLQVASFHKTRYLGVVDRIDFEATKLYVPTSYLLSPKLIFCLQAFALFNTSHSIAAMVEKGLLANIGAHGEPPLGLNYHAEMGFTAKGGLSNYEVPFLFISF